MRTYLRVIRRTERERNRERERERESSLNIIEELIVGVHLS